MLWSWQIMEPSKIHIFGGGRGVSGNFPRGAWVVQLIQHLPWAWSWSQHPGISPALGSALSRESASRGVGGAFSWLCSNKQSGNFPKENPSLFLFPLANSISETGKSQVITQRRWAQGSLGPHIACLAQNTWARLKSHTLFLTPPRLLILPLPPC